MSKFTSKFLAIVFAYMISVSSAFASDSLITTTAQNTLANIIANDQGMKPASLRVVIMKGKTELETANSNAFRIISLKIDTKSDKFIAVLSSGANQFTVSGKFERVRQIPILAHKMQRGETITKADIAYDYVNEKVIARGLVTDEKQLIGKALAKVALENKPVLETSLVAPFIIKRDSTVTATYQSNLITIQDNLVAMEDGALGDVIRLKNINSQRAVRGKVIAANQVQITSVDKQLASN